MMNSQPKEIASRREFFRQGGRLVAGVAVGGALLELIGCEPGTNILAPTGAQTIGGYAVDPEADHTKLIQAALDDPSNTVVTLGGGTNFFNSAHIRIPAGKTLKGGGSNYTQLKTNHLYSVLLESHSHLTDLRLTGPGASYTTNTSIVKPGVDTGRTAFFSVERCFIDNFSGAGINVWGLDGVFSNQFAIDNNTIYHNGNVGVQVGPGCWSFTVKNNHVYSNGANGIDCNGSYGIIQDNVCDHNGWTSIWAPNDRNGIILYSATDNKGVPRDMVNTQVLGNKCYNNINYGILIANNERAGIQNAHIYWNEIYSNSNGGIGVSQGGGGLITDLHVLDGYSRNNTGYGFDPLSSISSALVEGVWFDGNSRAAYRCASGVTFRNNTGANLPACG